MAVNSNTLRTFDHVMMKEEVVDKIYMFEQEDTPIYSGAPKVATKSATPEWSNNTLTAAASNKAEQGAQFVNSTLNSPSRVKNHTQIFTKVAEISGTDEAVAHHGYTSPMAYQKALKMSEIKRDIEFAITQNAPSIVAANGVAPQNAGLETWIVTNASRGSGGAGTGYNSGTGITAAATDGTQRVFVQSHLDTVLQSMYNNGAKPKTIYTNSFNKGRIDGFTGNQTRFSTEVNVISNNIEFYKTSFGNVKVALNPQMRQRTVIIEGQDGIAIRNLRTLRSGVLAKTGDSEREVILTELCSQVNEKAMGVIADLTTA